MIIKTMSLRIPLKWVYKAWINKDKSDLLTLAFEHSVSQRRLFHPTAGCQTEEYKFYIFRIQLDPIDFSSFFYFKTQHNSTCHVDPI